MNREELRHELLNSKFSSEDEFTVERSKIKISMPLTIKKSSAYHS